MIVLRNTKRLIAAQWPLPIDETQQSLACRIRKNARNGTICSVTIYEDRLQPKENVNLDKVTSRNEESDILFNATKLLEFRKLATSANVY